MHEADAALARGETKKNVPTGPTKIGPLLRFLWYAGRRGGLRTTPIAVVLTVADGDTLDLPGRPRIVHIPGHTPGSVAIHVPAVDALFVGDAMTTGHVLTGATGPQPAPFTMDPHAALASLAKLEATGATWILPRARCPVVRRHHGGCAARSGPRLNRRVRHATPAARLQAHGFPGTWLADPSNPDLLP